LYGSGRNTNYADVLSFAGLIDLGSQHYEGFPEYGSEQLLELDPDLIVTRLGQTQILCRYAGLDRLRACQDPARRIVELPESVISSAGVEMLVAAEWLHELAYPPQSQNSPK
jgi:ABC-type Fe3+-hydroxamate transport system substrate-binding protein